MELGRFGIWTAYRAIGEQNAAAAARLIESLGFGTVWLGGSPQVPALRPLLEATERIVVATGILNVWQSDPTHLQTVGISGVPQADWTALARALGLGAPRGG